MDSWSAILNSVAPVFLLILLGWALRYWQFLSSDALADMARLIYWVSIPCLLFYKTAAAQLDFGEAGRLLAVTLGATALSAGGAYWLARHYHMPPTAIGTFLQAVCRGNLAFVGLPVVFYAFSEPGRNAGVAEATALLAFGPMVVLYNAGAVWVLMQSRPAAQQARGWPLLRELLTNPLLLSCAVGVGWALLEWPIPMVMARTLDVLSQPALPLALICIGGTLVTTPFAGCWHWSVAAALFKVVMMPLCGYGLALWLGLNTDSTRVALILLACPTAAASYVLVHQIGGDEALASGSILLSTVLAVFSLTAVLALV